MLSKKPFVSILSSYVPSVRCPSLLYMRGLTLCMAHYRTSKSTSAIPHAFTFTAAIVLIPVAPSQAHEVNCSSDGEDAAFTSRSLGVKDSVLVLQRKSTRSAFPTKVCMLKCTQDDVLQRSRSCMSVFKSITCSTRN
ncbi:hypothetical protein BDR07DRAFT_754914 [Suillus spraguei]|nr:hypothetical protein BDR07DRAFT_754914 [Suillus spraguei]